MNTMASSFIFLLLSAFLSFFFSVDHVAVASSQKSISLAAFTKLELPSNAHTSGSFTFDFLHRGPYVGTSDGRILKYSRILNSFEDYAHTSPNRTKSFCDGTTGFDRSPICGVPTGLSFSSFTKSLYACDAYFGLTVVPFLEEVAEELGLVKAKATILVRNTDGVPPYRSLVAVDAAIDGNVYFTDASDTYDLKDANKSRQTGDSTGRLLKYDPITGKVTTLLTQLGRAVGVASSCNGTFVLVSEANAKKIQRYWLKGAKAGSEPFRTFNEGNPSQIKRNKDGDFWISLNIMKSDSTFAPKGVKVSPSGETLATVDLSNEYKQRITVVLEQDGKLYVVGANMNYIGRYDIVYT